MSCQWISDLWGFFWNPGSAKDTDEPHDGIPLCITLFVAFLGQIAVVVLAVQEKGEQPLAATGIRWGTGAILGCLFGVFAMRRDNGWHFNLQTRFYAVCCAAWIIGLAIPTSKAAAEGRLIGQTVAQAPATSVAYAFEEGVENTVAFKHRESFNPESYGDQLPETLRAQITVSREFLNRYQFNQLKCWVSVPEAKAPLPTAPTPFEVPKEPAEGPMVLDYMLIGLAPGGSYTLEVVFLPRKGKKFEDAASIRSEMLFFGTIAEDGIKVKLEP